MACFLLLISRYKKQKNVIYTRSLKVFYIMAWFMSVLSLIFNSLGNVESSKDISTKHYNETLKTIRSELKIYAKKNVVPGFEKVIEKNQYERGSEKYGGGCLNKITEKMTVLKLDGEKVTAGTNKEISEDNSPVDAYVQAISRSIKK